MAKIMRATSEAIGDASSVRKLAQRGNLSTICFVSIIIAICTYNSNAQTAFVDVSKEAGIDHQFEVFQGTFGGGAIVFDLNNDGYEDVFLTGGMADDALYLNTGKGSFNNIYEQSGLKTDIKYVTQGGVSADVNKDGWRDLYITTIAIKNSKEKIPRAINLLFINNGDGTFKDATGEYGLGEYLTFSTGAMFGDINLDGYPDLYVGNYFQYFEGKLHVMNDAIIVGSKQMAKGLLLINQSGKSFVDRYESYGLSYKGFGFGGAFSDYDNDGDLDLIVNHDFGYKSLPNKFLENKYPEDEFEDVSDTLNMDLPINGMGIAVGDYNNDGLMDYFVSNIRANPFMINQGAGKPFVNNSGALGTRINMLKDDRGKYMPVSWGANFGDFDNDTDLDLFVANGCLNPNVSPNPNYYFENKNGKYTNKAEQKGLADRGIGRGSVAFDYDNDGDLDILVVNQKAISKTFQDSSKTILFRNDSSSGNWLKIELEGIDADKNGIGSKVRIVIGDLTMIREIDGGSSHLSQNSAIAHFGVGNATIIDTVVVEWIGGKKQSLTNQPVNGLIKITEINNYNGVRRVARIGMWLMISMLGIFLIIKRNRVILMFRKEKEFGVNPVQ